MLKNGVITETIYMDANAIATREWSSYGYLQNGVGFGSLSALYGPRGPGFLD